MAYDHKKKYSNEIEFLNDIAFKSSLNAVECKIPPTTIRIFIDHLVLFKDVAFPGMKNSSPEMIAPGEPEIIFPMRVAMYFNHFATTYLFLHRLLSGQPTSLKGFCKDKTFVSSIIVEKSQISNVLACLTTELCNELDKYCLGMLSSEWVRIKKTTGKAPSAWQTILEYTMCSLDIAGVNVDLDKLFNITGKKNAKLDDFLKERSLYFCENILTMMERVQCNIVDIAAAFLSIDLYKIASDNIFIKDVHISNNDSHRHGRHVVILELEYKNRTAKIVYKPSDVETDCLIYGDVNFFKAINHNYYRTKSSMHKKFLSIVELVNKYVVDDIKYPAPIPTYKILPYNPGSDSSLERTHHDFDNAYGFIEFIEYYRGFQNNEEYVNDYWYVCGKTIALAILVGSCDVHYENFICGLLKTPAGMRQYAPYLIDLEASFNRSVTIGSTLIFNSTFGICDSKIIENSHFTRSEESPFWFNDGDSYELPIDKNNHLLMFKKRTSKCAEYLFDMVHGVKSVSRIKSFNESINDLLALTPVFKGVVVRFVPVKTNTWTTLHKDMFYKFIDQPEDVDVSDKHKEMTEIIYAKLQKKYEIKNGLITPMNLRRLIKYVVPIINKNSVICELLNKSLCSGEPNLIIIKIIEHVVDEVSVGDIPVFYMKWTGEFWVFLSSRGEEFCKFKTNGQYTINIEKELINRVMDQNTERGIPFFEDIIKQLFETSL